MDDALVSAEELAGVVGLHERQVRKLAERGVLQRSGRGKYPLGDSIQAYIRHLREQAAGRSASDEDDGQPDLTRERALLARTQREGQGMKNAIMRAELIPVEDVETVVGAVLDATRAKIMAIPTKAAPLLLGLDRLAEARDVLTTLIHGALDEIAGTTVIIASASDRARRRAGRAAIGGQVDEEAGPAA